MVKDLADTLLAETASIREAMRCIDVNSSKIVLVVDDRNRLMGTITDGDIRRGVLRGLELSAAVGAIMNTHPAVGALNETYEARQARMREHRIRHLPIVADGVLIGLELLEAVPARSPMRSCVVLMAGGLGTRLRPLTATHPKPLLFVGDKPILETIIERFASHGFSRFFIAVNYKAELVEEYFGDGAERGVQINYLREDTELGTAGALSLMPSLPDAPFIVMNGDVLTKLDFGELLAYHVEQGAKATMCVREHSIEVPYGVVAVEGQRILSIDEKPVHNYLINAGVYVLEPDVLSLVSEREAIDMPQLFGRILRKGWNASVYPVRDYWLDIGAVRDFHIEFEKVFK